MFRIRFLLIILALPFLFTSCRFYNNAKEYEKRTEVFMQTLLKEDYDACIDMIDMQHELMATVKVPEMKQRLVGMRDVVIRHWGRSLEYKMVKAQKKFSTVKGESLPPNSTLLLVEFSNKKEFGVLQVLFDDKSKKIMSIKPLDVLAPVPSMTLFWLLTPIVLCVPVFLFYIIRQIKRSKLRRKWLKYIAVLFFNVPTFIYSPFYGFSFKLLYFKILFGIGFLYEGYTGAAWELGLPLGALYWLWKLKQLDKQDKYDQEIQNLYAQNIPEIPGIHEEQA